MGTAHQYLSAIMARRRVHMDPVRFEPDWADHPRRHKFYVEPEYLPLPGGPDDGAPLHEGVHGGQPADGRLTSLTMLGDLLQDSYGQLGRRLQPNANSDVVSLPMYGDAKWSRGTASGGGLYPVSIYWVTGGSGPVLPGVYYYCPPQHAMQRVLTGDVTAEVREAVGAGTDQFLVLGLKFWQNSFKYNSFTYHAVTMDVGTVTQTWRMWAQARGLRLVPRLWFDERRLGRLLGVEPDQEGVMAVVPLPWAADGPVANRAHPDARIGYVERERSRRPRTFDIVTTVHKSTMEHATERPAPEAIGAAAATPAGGPPAVALPTPPALTGTLRAALRARRSSFGMFSSADPLRTDELSAVLAAAAGAAAFPCDANPAPVRLAKSYVFVNHVRGIEPGAYEHDPVANTLHRCTAGPRGEFLQGTYFLENYNLEQAGVVIVPAVRADTVMDVLGNRGYRLTNAVIGAVSQAVYTACAGLGLGCGVALGFDNLSYVEELGLADRGEAPLLIMMVGHERPGSAEFDYSIIERREREVSRCF